MIDLAKRNAAKDGVANVEFHLATISALPLPDASADVVISNCVINLAPDKPAVFREIARVLKPGGRVAVSDIALKRPLPDEIAKDVMAYVGCIAGALLIEDYRRQLTEAGFADVVVVDAGADLNAYSKIEGQNACCSPAASAPVALGVPQSAASCCGPAPAASDENSVHDGLAKLLNRYDVNEYAASVKVYAVKP
jgi:SAM-dependent methyltransferase